MLSEAFFALPSLVSPQLTAENPAPRLGATSASKGQTRDFPRAPEQTAGGSRAWGQIQEDDKTRRGSNTQQALLGGA